MVIAIKDEGWPAPGSEDCEPAYLATGPRFRLRLIRIVPSCELPPGTLIFVKHLMRKKILLHSWVFDICQSSLLPLYIFWLETREEKKMKSAIAFALAIGIGALTVVSYSEAVALTARQIAVRKCNAQVISQYPNRNDTVQMDLRTKAWIACMRDQGQRP